MKVYVIMSSGIQMPMPVAVHADKEEASKDLNLFIAANRDQLFAINFWMVEKELLDFDGPLAQPVSASGS